MTTLQSSRKIMWFQYVYTVSKGDIKEKYIMFWVVVDLWRKTKPWEVIESNNEGLEGTVRYKQVRDVLSDIVNFDQRREGMRKWAMWIGGVGGFYPTEKTTLQIFKKGTWLWCST